MEWKCGILPGTRFRICRKEFRLKSGILYLAEDLHTSRPAEIFQYEPFFLPDGEEREKTRQEDSIIRQGAQIFREGAEKLTEIGKEEGVCPILAWNLDKDPMYLVQEYPEGTVRLSSLSGRKWFHSGRWLDHFSADLLLALCVLHKKGVFLGWLDPRMIFVARDGHVRISGFGFMEWMLAQTADDLYPGPGLTRRGSTDGLLPPEWYTPGKNLGPWSDMYEAAACIFQLQTGSPPPSVYLRLIADEGRKEGRLSSFRYFWKKQDPVIRKALSLEVEERFTDMAAFLAAWEAEKKGRTGQPARMARRMGISAVAGVFALILWNAGRMELRRGKSYARISLEKDPEGESNKWDTERQTNSRTMTEGLEKSSEKNPKKWTAQTVPVGGLRSVKSSEKGEKETRSETENAGIAMTVKYEENDKTSEYVEERESMKTQPGETWPVETAAPEEETQPGETAVPGKVTQTIETAVPEDDTKSDTKSDETAVPGKETQPGETAVPEKEETESRETVVPKPRETEPETAESEESGPDKVPSEQGEPLYAGYATVSLNVRDFPDPVTGKIIGTLDFGEMVTVLSENLGEKGGWIFLSCRFGKGYAAGQYISKEKPVPPAQERTEAAPASADAFRTESRGSSGAGTQSSGAGRNPATSSNQKKKEKKKEEVIWEGEGVIWD